MVPESVLFNTRNTHFVHANGYQPIYFDAILDGVLVSVIQRGAEETVKLLEKVIDESKIKISYVVILSGIELESELQIGDITLIPFSSLPNSPFKELFDHSNSQEHSWGLEKLLPKATAALIGYESGLIIEATEWDYHNGKKIPYAPDDIEKYVPKGEFYKKTTEIWKILNLLNCSPVYVAGWHSITDSIPISHFFGMHYSSIDKPKESKKFTAEEIESIIHLFLSLNDKEKLKLYVPLERLYQSKIARNQVDIAINLGVAFESLLSNDSGDNSNLTYKMSLRGARFLENELETRKEVKKQLSKLSNVRLGFCS